MKLSPIAFLILTLQVRKLSLRETVTCSKSYTWSTFCQAHALLLQDTCFSGSGINADFLLPTAAQGKNPSICADVCAHNSVYMLPLDKPALR